MFRGFVAGVLATIVVALIGGYIVLRSGLIPTNADAKPGWVETWAANTSLEATLAREAPKGPNPVAMLDENLITGIDLYGQHCAICHGTAKGEASASPVATGEYPPPPQLRPTGYGKSPSRRKSGSRIYRRPGENDGRLCLPSEWPSPCAVAPGSAVDCEERPCVRSRGLGS